MADNTTLSAGAGGDTIRTEDRAGIKTPVSLLDVGGAAGPEAIVGDVPMPISGTVAATQSGGWSVSIGAAIPAGGNVIGAVTQSGAWTVTANAGTNLNTSALALESGGNLAAVAASLSVLDDWDETDRAKVNVIAGQAGITAGAGAVAANTPRVTHASDDPVTVALQVIDDWDESDRAKVNPIAGQAGVAGGSGAVSALTQRVCLATDVPLPAGTNAIGKLSANSGVDIGDVDVTSLPAIPAGNNNIGDVDIASQNSRYQKGEQGTAIVWGESGGSGVTNTLSLDALANDAGRMGAAVDLGAAWDQEYAVYLTVETGTAPTAGTTVELYLACSRDNSEWPGKVTGSDAAYPATVDANKKQLWPPVMQLVATNDTNTTLRQNPVIWRPQARYVVPVLVNKLGQAFRDQGTASNNTSRVILVPLRAKEQDSA